MVEKLILNYANYTFVRGMAEGWELALLRVFLVEDESVIRETLRDTVPWMQYGYTFVGEAGDGELALPLIRQTKPDVLITDIKMPFMDGLELSKLVLKEFPRMKVIIISGHDDFEDARQAISIGIEQYILKPITKKKLLDVLENVREKIEREASRDSHQAQFHLDEQEYEQYARRRFFEQIAAGQLAVHQIYEEAAKLELDLRAQCYALAFFSTPPEHSATMEPDSNHGSSMHIALLEHFLKYPEYILFRWNVTTYAILMKGDSAQFEDYIRYCIDTVREQYTAEPSALSWYIAVSTPTQRLSALPTCFEEVSRLWAYRHIVPEQHILTTDTVGFLTGTEGDGNLSGLDVSKVNPTIFWDAMKSTDVEDIPSFVAQYIHSISDAVESKLFCQYLMLSVRFTATEFVVSLGVAPTEFLAKLECLSLEGQNVTEDELKQYMQEIFMAAVDLRHTASNSQIRGILGQAVRFIDEHYTEYDFSLNRAANEINISPNYLSAVFSQEMGCTMTEYITNRRVERACELLRNTDKRSGDIAFEVGYRDAHYFSFIFKKNRGCTPRDYRASRRKV